MSDVPSTPSEPTPEGPVPGTTPVPDPTPVKKAGWKSWAAAGGVAVVVVIGGVLATRHHSSSNSVAASTNTNQNPGQGAFANRGAAGTITSIKGGTITLKPIAGRVRPNASTSTTLDTNPVTVKTTSATTYSEVVKGAVSDLKAGETVIIRGTTTGTTIAADDVIEGQQGLGGGQGQGGGRFRQFQGEGVPPNGVVPPTDASGQPVNPPQDQGGQGRFAGGFAAGTIASVNGDTFTITVRDGSTMTVTTTSATTVSITKAIGLKDLKKGDTILVVGDRSGDTVTATSIRKGDASTVGAFGFGGPGGFFGRRGGTTSTTAATS